MNSIIMKQDSTTTTTTNTVTVCGNCGVEEKRLLLHVRHRGMFRRLCTSCVLRLHPQSFCPTCFLVFDRSPPTDVVTCFKCYSSSHLNCVSIYPPKNPYVCPSCVNPNAPIFTLKKVKTEESGDDDGISTARVIDKKGARVLLTAARIASISMNKAAVAAKAELERRAKEAGFTKKRAREALEHVVYLMAKEKKNNNHRVANVNSSVVAAHVVENNHKIDSSNEVLEALNAVELKEKERLQGYKTENVVSNRVATDVEDSVRLGVNSVSNNENGRSGDLGNSDNKINTEGEKVSNGLPLVPLVDRQQSMENTHAVEENNGPQQ